MYFRNRAEAGRQLAAKLEYLRGENVVILSLSPGGIIVGAQIAMKLHANLTMLLTESIYLPGEIDALAAISSAGGFTYNNMFSAGQLEEFITEYHSYIEQERMFLMHRINTLISHDGVVDRNRLRHKVVILVSDGLSNGFSLDIAADFFKTVAIKKLVIAVPVASMNAIDRMHLLGDKVYCLGAAANFVTTNHYYDDNTVPPMSSLFKVMRNISVHWDRPALVPNEKTVKAPSEHSAKPPVTRSTGGGQPSRRTV